MLQCSEISPDNIKAQTRLPSCDTSAWSFADSSKCPKHSCINFTFLLLHLNWFILHLLPAQGKSISQAIIFIYSMYQEYYNHCKKPWDEKQADVITSEILVHQVTLLFLSHSFQLCWFLLTTTSRIWVTNFNSLGVLLCSVIKFDHGEISGEKQCF